MQATQWMNRTAQGPKWKPESAALRSWLLHAYDIVYRSFVYSRRAQGCHRGVKNGCQSVRQKAKGCGRGRKRCQFPLVQTVPVILQKKTVLVEIDTWTRKQKAKEKNNPCRSSKKVLSKRIPNPLKLSIQGHPGEMRQAGLRGGRQPIDVLDHPWETLARCRRRKAGLLVAEFCAHISMRAPQRSLNTTQSFQRGKSFPIASYPISFLPPL